MIVPFGTGGGSDITVRLLAPKIAAFLGQNIIVENRPGAGSTVGTDFVAKSAPDGYNFVLATLSSTGLAVGLYRNLPYDPVRDLTAISPTNFIPICHTVTTQAFRCATRPIGSRSCGPIPTGSPMAAAASAPPGISAARASWRRRTPRRCMCRIAAAGGSMRR